MRKQSTKNVKKINEIDLRTFHTTMTATFRNFDLKHGQRYVYFNDVLATKKKDALGPFNNSAVLI